jgi:hypothetical protein
MRVVPRASLALRLPGRRAPRRGAGSSTMKGANARAPLFSSRCCACSSKTHVSLSAVHRFATVRVLAHGIRRESSQRQAPSGSLTSRSPSAPSS